MKTALFSLVVWLIVSGLIYFAGKTFLPDPFAKITYFVSVIIAILAIVTFVAFLLGVATPWAL